MKYKINYLTAGNPQVNELKNINIFKKNTIAYKLLDPTNGFFFLESNALNNYYYYGDDEYPISKIVRNNQIFHVLDDKVTPSNNFNDMTSNEIGKFLGTHFYNLFVLPELKEYYTQEIKNLNDISKNISILVKDEDIEKKKKFIKESKEKVYISEKINIQHEDGSNFLNNYIQFIKIYLERIKNITFTQTASSTKTNSVQTNVKKYGQFVKDRRFEINNIMEFFNIKKYSRERNKLNLQNVADNVGDSFEKYYQNNKEYFKLVESTIKDVYNQKKKEEGKIIINYTPTSTAQELNDIEKNNFLSQFRLEFFSIFLSIMWVKATNKDPEIISYYKGLNKILGPYQKILQKIKRNDVMSNFNNISNSSNIQSEFNETFENFEKPDSSSDFQYSLAKKFKDLSPSITLQQQGYSKLHLPDSNDSTKIEFCLEFPDCGEVSSRNFVKILCYNKDTNKYDIEKLKKYGASHNLIKYFETYYNEDKINNIYHLEEFEITIKLNGKDTNIKSKFNSNDAWNLIVSGIDNVNYKNNCNNVGYEIKSGKSINNDRINMLVVLNNLFPYLISNPTSAPTVSSTYAPSISFEDFNNDDIAIKFNAHDERNGLGDVIIKVKSINEHYIFHLEYGHFWIEFVTNHNSEDDEEEDEESEDESEDEDEDDNIDSNLIPFVNCIKNRKDNKQCFYLNFLKNNFDFESLNIDNLKYSEKIDEILKIWKYNKFFYLYYSFFSIENLLDLIHNQIFKLILTTKKRNIYIKYIKRILNFGNPDLISRLNIDYDMINNIDELFEANLDKSSINVKCILYNLTNEIKFKFGIKNITLKGLAKFKDEEITEKINFLPDDLENLEILQNYNGVLLELLEIGNYKIPYKLKKLTYHPKMDRLRLETVFKDLENLEELNLFGWYGEDGISSQLKLPKSLKKINFGDQFDTKNNIEFLIKTRIEEITFGKGFELGEIINYDIVKFPITLKSLTIHYGSLKENQLIYLNFKYLNHQIKNLKKLTLIFDYNKKFENYDNDIKKIEDETEKKKIKHKYFFDDFRNIVGNDGLKCYNELFKLKYVNFKSVQNGDVIEIPFKLNTKIYDIYVIKSDIQQSGSQLTDEELNEKIFLKLEDLYNEDINDYDPFIAGYYDDKLNIPEYSSDYDY
tara:strand:- start:1322 stop:4738 length:3417 start_codon:yes stop_codon:yes gene_type:complete